MSVLVGGMMTKQKCIRLLKICFPGSRYKDRVRMAKRFFGYTCLLALVGLMGGCTTILPIDEPRWVQAIRTIDNNERMEVVKQKNNSCEDYTRAAVYVVDNFQYVVDKIEAGTSKNKWSDEELQVLRAYIVVVKTDIEKLKPFPECWWWQYD